MSAPVQTMGPTRVVLFSLLLVGCTAPGATAPLPAAPSGAPTQQEPARPSAPIEIAITVDDLPRHGGDLEGVSRVALHEQRFAAWQAPPRTRQRCGRSFATRIHRHDPTPGTNCALLRRVHRNHHDRRRPVVGPRRPSSACSTRGQVVALPSFGVSSRPTLPSTPPRLGRGALDRLRAAATQDPTPVLLAELDLYAAVGWKRSNRVVAFLLSAPASQPSRVLDRGDALIAAGESGYGRRLSGSRSEL